MSWIQQHGDAFRELSASLYAELAVSRNAMVRSVTWKQSEFNNALFYSHQALQARVNDTTGDARPDEIPADDSNNLLNDNTTNMDETHIATVQAFYESCDDLLDIFNDWLQQQRGDNSVVWVHRSALKLFLLGKLKNLYGNLMPRPTPALPAVSENNVLRNTRVK